MRSWHPQYYQNDPLWKNLVLGSGKTTIGQDGCAITSAANAANYFGHDLTPGALDLLATNRQGFASENEFVWSFLNIIFPDIFFVGFFSATDQEIATLLADPTLFIIGEFDASPIGGPKGSSHFTPIIDQQNVFDVWDNKMKPLSFYPNRLGLRVYRGKASETSNMNTNNTQSSPLPANYADIVHGSSQWDATVTAYMTAGTLPKDCAFEDLQKVIAGYKSQATAAQNQLNQSQIDLSSAIASITNLNEQVGNLKSQLTESDTTWNARYTALKNTLESNGVTTQQWESKVSALQSQLDDANSAKGSALVQVATLQTKLDQSTSSQSKSIDLSTFSVQKLFLTLVQKVLTEERGMHV